MSVLTKKLLRTLWQSRGQSIAVMAVVLCGTACYIAISSAYSNLLLTRDTYYAHYRFQDFELLLERAPRTSVFKLESIPGVRQVRGRIVKDVNLDLADEDEPRTGRIISMPNPHEAVIDDIHMSSGRYFSEGAQNEVIVSDRFARENDLQIGENIHATIESRKYSLRIVGTALSPEYVYMIRNVQELIPSPARFGILWVPEEFAETALDMSAACNNIVGHVEDVAQLEQILDKAEDILEPYGVIAKVKGEDQISNRFVSDEIKGLSVTARIVPPMFQGVAALIIFVLLNRMVRKERTEIGLLKAYGYANWKIAWHYIQFALVLAICGCLAGFFVGQWLSRGMVNMYVMFYEFPLLRSRIYPDVLGRSMGLAIGFAVLGALSAAIQAVHINPAESMRPEAPRYGHRTMIERIRIVWANLSFTWKMIARNVSRNGFRAGLNSFGVMVSTGLLLMGFFMTDSMDYMLDFQYNELQREDMRISLVTERGADALKEVKRLDHVRLAEPMLIYPFEMKSAWHQDDIGVIGLPQRSELFKLADMDGNFIDVGDGGLVVSDKLAQRLGVRTGDTISLKPLTGRVTDEKSAVVSKVVNQFLGMSAYMNIDALSRLLNESLAMNAALVKVEDAGQAREVNKALKDVPAVAAVEIKADSYQSLIDTLALNMLVMNTMMTIFAAVIACSIIYNVTTISLAERQRELASLRVLGFSVQEVGRILYYENFVLGAIGVALGIPFGLGICRLIVKAYDNELFRMPFHIDSSSFLFASGLIALFVLLANGAVHHKIGRLDMIEVLKQRE